MEIVAEADDNYRIRITKDGDSALVEFNPYDKELKFCEDNKVSEILQKNEYQFRKILHTKRMESYYVGFELQFSLRSKKDVAAFNDMEKLVILDKRDDELRSYALDNYQVEQMPKIYTDGSFLEEINNGAYALIIKYEDGNYDYYTEEVEVKNSNLIELMAAMRGVELLTDRDRIRIVTDSQYVRKGLTEWIINWKLNDWHTVNGKKVKHIEYWKRFDRLTEGKYIEFEWVKGHSDHFENELCDIFARERARD